MATNVVPEPTTPARKTSREEAAKKIAGILEEHMTNAGLSEKEKNARVKKFSDRVDNAIRRSSKR